MWPFVDEEIGFVRLPPNTHEAFWKGLLVFTIMEKVNHFYCYTEHLPLDSSSKQTSKVSLSRVHLWNMCFSLILVTCGL
jgi:hypothetical protein